jgi:hypothetical protein
MAEEISLGSTKIKYEGIFDWKELYSLIRNWFIERKYNYFEIKNAKKPTSFGFEFEFDAKGEREETNYVKHTVSINVHGYHMEDVELIVNGEKKNKNRTGMMIIEIKPTLTLDWDNKWETTTFKKHVKKFLHKHVMKKQIDQWKGKLYYESYKLHTQIKENLDMEGKYSAY